MNAQEKLHEDFAHLAVSPGEALATSRPELFDIVNLIAFGGATDRLTHVPTELGRVGPVVLWESTGASDSLPFWNTNFNSDMYLYIVDGGVRVQLKEPEGSEIFGEYIARTGDLFRLPKDIAHRTFSLDGKRRITLEILGHDPSWSTIGQYADVRAAERPEIGGFRFASADDVVAVSHEDTIARVPVDMFRRGARALVAWDVHLGHNEFDGGFVVHDHGDTVTLKVGDRHEVHDPSEVIAVLKAILADIEDSTTG